MFSLFFHNVKKRLFDDMLFSDGSVVDLGEDGFKENLEIPFIMIRLELNCTTSLLKTKLFIWTALPDGYGLNFSVQSDC